MLPLLLLLRHKCNKARVLSQVIQLGVALEKWIIREALIGGDLQPFYRLLWFIHKSVGGSNVVRRVMKVSVTTSDPDSALDRGFRLSILASLSQHHSFHAGHHPTLIFILRIVFEVSVNEDRGFHGPAQAEQSVGCIKGEEFRVLLERSAIEYLKSFRVFGPAHIDNAEAVPCQGVARIDR